MSTARHRRPSRRGARPARLLVLSVLVAMGTAGLASAYWTGSGSGTGSGTTGTTVAVALSPALPAATLYPGGRADVVLTMSNANLSAVLIDSLALDTSRGTGGFAVDAGHSACALSSLAFTLQTNTGAGWTVAARAGAANGTLAITLPNALSMDVGAANLCQGASFTVYLAAG